MKTLIELVFWSCFIHVVHGHGYMHDPISRSATNNVGTNNGAVCNSGATDSTPWGSNCGGAWTQNDKNGGKCGACGDDYSASKPRLHELGGRFVNDAKPTRIYLQGQTIDTLVKITAAHQGAFVFKLCTKLDLDPNPQADALTNCFYSSDAITLGDENGNPVSIGVGPRGNYTQKVTLPADFTCPYGCVLQWFYKAGNNHGSNQEHFVNCADIAIVTCKQYQSDEYAIDWCGYGPTDAVKNCQISDSDNGYYGGGTGSNGDGSTQDGNSGEQCPDDDSGTGTPSCNACTNAQSPTCANECCSEGERDVYMSTISGAPDMWCQTHCTQKPPFCPKAFCEGTKMVHWVNVCSAKKSLNTILKKLEQKAALELSRKQADDSSGNHRNHTPIA